MHFDLDLWIKSSTYKLSETIAAIDTPYAVNVPNTKQLHEKI